MTYILYIIELFLAYVRVYVRVILFKSLNNLSLVSLSYKKTRFFLHVAE